MRRKHENTTEEEQGEDNKREELRGEYDKRIHYSLGKRRIRQQKRGEKQERKRK